MFAILSQPLLVLINHLGGSCNFSKVMNTNLAHAAMLMVSFYTADLSTHMWVTKPPTYVFRILPLVGGQW